MKSQNNLPIKVYKNMLANNYKQTNQEYNKIKKQQKRVTNPILQKEDRYVPPRTRGGGLAREYVKKMAEKPEKDHIKRIPIPTNLSSGVKVVTEQEPVKGIKIGTIHKKSNSVEKRRVRKKLIEDKLRFNDDFYHGKEVEVTNIKNQARFKCRPKVDSHFELGYDEPKLKEYRNIYGYTRKVENTKDRLFPKETKELKRKGKKIRFSHDESGYVNRNVDHLSDVLVDPKNADVKHPITSKPCNNDFDTISNEARKNYSIRYYFDNYTSQW